MMTLINNSELYWNFILQLRNEYKEGFIQQDDITVEEHQRFMEEYGDEYFICLFDGCPVGFIGCVNGDIRVAVDKEYRNLGIAKFMIEHLPIKGTAKVKIDNISSIKALEACGYEQRYVILERK